VSPRGEKRDPLDVPVAGRISLTKRQWQILDEVRGNVPRGRYLWSFVASELRDALGEDVPGGETRLPDRKALEGLPAAVVSKANSNEWPDF